MTYSREDFAAAWTDMQNEMAAICNSPTHVDVEDMQKILNHLTALLRCTKYYSKITRMQWFPITKTVLIYKAGMARQYIHVGSMSGAEMIIKILEDLV